MANFEFRSCRVKKVNFFCHRAPTVGGPKKFFCSNFFKCTQRLKFQKIVESEQQPGISIYLVNSKLGAQFLRNWPNPDFSAQEQLIVFHFFHYLDIPKLAISKKSMDGPLRKLSLKVEFFTSSSFISMRYTEMNQFSGTRDSFYCKCN